MSKEKDTLKDEKVLKMLRLSIRGASNNGLHKSEDDVRMNNVERKTANCEESHELGTLNFYPLG